MTDPTNTITFVESFARFPYDTEEIAKLMGVHASIADSLINARMNVDRGIVDANPSVRQEDMLRRRDDLRAIRQQHRVA